MPYCVIYCTDLDKNLLAFALDMRLGPVRTINICHSMLRIAHMLCAITFFSGCATMQIYDITQ